MAQDLQSGFKNNVNIICIRSSGSSLQVVTDSRRIDLDDDGAKEKVTITNGTAVTNTSSGNKMKPASEATTANGVHYEVPGAQYSILDKTAEGDGGKDISGQTYTIDFE